METAKPLGQVAYEAFHAPADPPRPWDELTSTGRDRWDFIAKAIIEHWAQRNG